MKLSFFLTERHQIMQNRHIKLDSTTKTRVQKAIETRLMVAPEDYEEPLRKTLKGCWKLRVGDYRVVFAVEAKRLPFLEFGK